MGNTKSIDVVELVRQDGEKFCTVGRKVLWKDESRWVPATVVFTDKIAVTLSLDDGRSVKVNRPLAIGREIFFDRWLAISRERRGFKRESEINDEEAATREESCVVCLTNRKKMAAACGHLCVCMECSSKIDKCPICRKQWWSVRQIFA